MQCGFLYPKPALQVLSLRSKVLRGMFADLMGAGGSDSEARVGCEREADVKVCTSSKPLPMRAFNLLLFALRTCARWPGWAHEES